MPPGVKAGPPSLLVDYPARHCLLPVSTELGCPPSSASPRDLGHLGAHFSCAVSVQRSAHPRHARSDCRVARVQGRTARVSSAGTRTPLIACTTTALEVLASHGWRSGEPRDSYTPTPSVSQRGWIVAHNRGRSRGVSDVHRRHASHNPPFGGLNTPAHGATAMCRSRVDRGRSPTSCSPTISAGLRLPSASHASDPPLRLSRATCRRSGQVHDLEPLRGEKRSRDRSPGASQRCLLAGIADRFRLRIDVGTPRCDPTFAS